MIRTLLIALTAAFIAAGARAQDAAPTRFFIERIEVRNAKRVSPDLVISESLLHTGIEYSEEELRAASLRLSRLPFLLSADFALEKGSERGRHVLIINIAETKPFFYLIDTRPNLKNEKRQSLVDYADYLGTDSNEAAVGVRSFVGRRGVAHFGVTSRRDRQIFTTDYSAFAVGYTQYDLFGTRAFATLNLRQPFDTAESGAISPQLVVGVPITTNQTLTFDYEEARFRPRSQHVAAANVDVRRQDAERLVSLTWIYNTTNQPFVPTSGTIVRVAPLWAMRDRASYVFQQFAPGPSPPLEPYAEHTNGYGFDVLASHYWELSDRDAVSATVQGGWSRMSDEVTAALLPRVVRSNPAYGIVGGSYSYNLWAGSQRTGDSRLEVDVQYVARERGFDREGDSRYFDNEEGVNTSADWVRRSSWGTLRLGLGYTWRR